MLDPKLLRDSPEVVRAAVAKKHLDVDVDAVLAMDVEWRAQLGEVIVCLRHAVPAEQHQHEPRRQRELIAAHYDLKHVYRLILMERKKDLRYLWPVCHLVKWD